MKITKRVVDALAPSPDGDVWAWDDELKGFGVRMKPSRAASFIVQYKIQGRTRRMAFAKVGIVTPEQARTEARRLLNEVHNGGDPSRRRHEARAAYLEVVLTVADLCEQHLEAARAGLALTRRRKRKAATTVSNDEGWMRRHVFPLIGNVAADDLTRQIVQRMHDDIAAGKTAGVFKTKARGKAIVRGGATVAARVVEMLGGIYTWAERRGIVFGPNPAHGVEKHKAEARDRVLDAKELARLGAVLREQAQRQPIATVALRLIALTGSRREEVCALRWSEVDAATSCLRMETTKTGRSMRPIGSAALRLLEAIPRHDSEWVFPNRDRTGSADLKKRITALFDAAGMPDARSHDLRRTFASAAADEGYGDATIAELLGHARQGVTARHYIRRPDAALVAAADKVSARIAAMMEGRETGYALPLKNGADGDR